MNADRTAVVAAPLVFDDAEEALAQRAPHIHHPKSRGWIVRRAGAARGRALRGRCARQAQRPRAVPVLGDDGWESDLFSGLGLEHPAALDAVAR